MPSAFLSRPIVLSLALSAALGLPGAAQADFLYGRLVPAAGVEPNGDSNDVDVSADGRTVVFSSSATNWSSLGADYHGDRAVAVDLDTGVIDIVSASPTGTVFRGEAPVVSGDGRYVAFLTYGSSYGPSWQVLRKDRQTGALEVASATAAGEPASNGTNDNAVSISADGRYVAFDTGAPNLVPSGSGTQVFVKDMLTGAVEMASVRSDGSPAGSGDGTSAKTDDSVRSPTGSGACGLVSDALSGSGRYLVMSCSPAMVPGASGGQIYLRDLQSNTIELISRSASAPNGSSAFAYRPAISPNGRFVTFQSRGYGGLGYANGADSAGNSGVYLRDRQAGTILPIPRASAIPADDYDSCGLTAVSDIGSVLLSCLYNWSGAGRFPQVLLFVPGAGAPEVLSVNAAGQPGNDASGDTLGVNASGLSMAWESTASDIVADDHNDARDVFLLVEESVLTETIFADGFDPAPALRRQPGHFQPASIVPGSRPGGAARD
ncbi:TolB family protein [Dokdonella ginsengisoli]|uniref:TolB family protein n=1 Tax=Dokdonella ginsengisoli TaxID=363846 RepID=A0ABV9QTW3_9GAMM